MLAEGEVDQRPDDGRSVVMKGQAMFVQRVLAFEDGDLALNAAGVGVFARGH